ncbi:facilitated trehalose transporter Tret1-like [Belonocnema kinseyi]|uniref:facilitated trehalose transporter Tret1-like n=1 Tax=Belonocnema kinseyi TaxID=2817044 RepID=UPI00143D5F81|nr:facilitated trehalose transporter Tret1-like [Belonocnema kinseyi]
MNANEIKTGGEVVRSRNQYFVQFMSIISGYVLAINVGAHLAWTSPALPYLTSESTKFYLTNNQGAWIASINSVSSIFGSVTNSLLVNRIGHRFTILIFSASDLISWILINFADNYSFLLIARIVAGFSMGGSFAFLPIYIGEVTGKKIRGRFLAVDRICINLGVFFITSLGAFFSYETMNLAMIFVAFLAICTFPLTSETPYYYLMKGREEEAIKTLMKLSRVTRSEIIMADIERMKKAMERQDPKNSSIQELFKDRGSRKALIIMLLTYFVYAFSGALSIQAYAQGLFKQSDSSLAPEYSAMILTGVQIFSGLPSTQLIDYWGRRPVYVFSGIASAIGLGTVALYFFLKEFLETNVSSVSWLPLFGLVLYQFMCNFGILTIPTVLVGEIFSVKVKRTAVMIGAVFLAIFLFTSKIMTPLLNDALGIYTTLWIFSSVCLLGPLVIVYIIPETKGSNLEEVLTLLGGVKEKKRTNVPCQLKIQKI